VPLLASRLLWRALRVVQQWVQWADGKEFLAGVGELLCENIDEVALESAARVGEDANAARYGLLPSRALANGSQKLVRHKGVDGDEVEPAVADVAAAGVRRPDHARHRGAYQPVPLAVGQPRGLFSGEPVGDVVQDDDAVAGGGDPAEERRERGGRVGDEGLPQGHEVGGEGRFGGGVWRRGGVRGDGELVEVDAAEGAVAPAVDARPGLADVLHGRRVVHGQPARRELQRQVQQCVQVALRRERHRHDDNRLHWHWMLGLSTAECPVGYSLQGSASGMNTCTVSSGLHHNSDRNRSIWLKLVARVIRPCSVYQKIWF